MSGHSKWTNIKVRKEKQDYKRGRLFTKLIREMKVAAEIGGSNSDTNPRLRLAIDKSLAANMNRNIINRAIKCGVVSKLDKMEKMIYEGYGLGGVAIIIECLTSNRNRTASELRYIFRKYGGELGVKGSVSYLFNHIGQIIIDPSMDLDKVMEISIESDASNIEISDDNSIIVKTNFDVFTAVKLALEKSNIKINAAKTIREVKTKVFVYKNIKEKTLQLIHMLESLNDVQSIYTNAHFE